MNEQCETGSTKALIFNVGSDSLALPIEAIKEIIEYGAVTRVPLSPGNVRGVINLRGNVVPVVDLAGRLGLGSLQLSRRSCVVIVETENQENRLDIGLAVDGVSQVIEISDDEVEPPPAFGARVAPGFLDGMGKVDGHFVMMLNTARVLAIDEIGARHEERAA